MTGGESKLLLFLAALAISAAAFAADGSESARSGAGPTSTAPAKAKPFPRWRAILDASDSVAGPATNALASGERPGRPAGRKERRRPSGGTTQSSGTTPSPRPPTNGD